MKKCVLSSLMSFALAGILLLSGPACSPLQPDQSGSIAISLSSAGGSSTAKFSQTVRLSRLRCILSESGVKVRDNVFVENNGYFTVVFRDLLPGDAYHLVLYGGVSASSTDAVAEQDSIIVESGITTSIELVLHSLIPTLAAPENGACLTGSEITFNWNDSEYTNRYLLFIATDEAFSKPVLIQSEITSTHYTLSGCSAPATFYWKVSARHDTGGYSSWSETRYVTIN